MTTQPHTPELLALVQAGRAKIETKDNTLVAYSLSRAGWVLLWYDFARDGWFVSTRHYVGNLHNTRDEASVEFCAEIMQRDN